MKKITSILLALLVVSATYAQHRGRIENLTDYSQLSSSSMRKIGSRATAPLPCTGSPKIPVILVQFPDLKFTSTNSNGNPTDQETWESYNKLFNGTGVDGETYTGSKNLGSVRDYFIEQSDSLFKPQFGVIGPVTLSNGYAYYGQNSGTTKDINISKFFSEAFSQAMLNYNVNWSEYDNNGDGTIDFVFYIFAGYGENNYAIDDPNVIWPKEMASASTVTVNGTSKRIGGYGCTNELYASSTTEKIIQDGIGTCIHELSHALGLPDFYDTKYVAFGMDYWDVMDSGCYTRNGWAPVCYTGYERDFMGWRPIVEIDYDANETITLLPMEDKDGVAYKIANPANKNEYFIFENRQNKNFDIWLGYFGSNYSKLGKAHGLMITHVDYFFNSWSANTVNVLDSHQRMTIVPADNELILQNTENYFTSLSKDLYPGPDNVTEMSSYAVFNGGKINMSITGITETDGVITFHLNGGTPDGIKGVTYIKENNNNIYDMMGRRTEIRRPGIYIIGGKKVLVN